MKRMMLLMLVLGAVAAAQPQCGIYSVRGTWAVSDWGWIMVPQGGAPLPLAIPVALMGVASIEQDGKVSISGPMIYFGQRYQFTGEGTAEVNTDCTGTIRALVKVSGSDTTEQQVLKIIVLPDQKEILTFHMNEGDLGVGTWKRMSAVPSSAKL